MATFKFAQQIQPLNGQILAEVENMELADFREWNVSDRDEFPQAERQATEDDRLIVDTSDGSVWLVPADENAEAEGPCVGCLCLPCECH